MLLQRKNESGKYIMKTKVIIFIRIVLLGVFSFAVSGVVSADAGDDTLLNVIKKSDLVVSAEIVSMDGPTFDEIGTAIYNLECKNIELLHGKAPAGDALQVFVTHPELKDSDRFPVLPKGSRCILFL